MKNARIFSDRKISCLVLGVVVGAIYVYCVMTINERAIEGFADTRLVQNVLPVLVLMNVICIILAMKRIGLGALGAFEVLLWLGVLQGIYAVISLAYTPLKEFSNSLYAVDGSSNEFVTASRVYGISSDFTYGTPIYHGALAGVAVYLMVTYGKRYWLFLPPILAVTVMNGRTGLVVCLAVSIAAIIVGNIRRQKILALLFSCAAMALFIYVGVIVVHTYVPATYDFVMKFVSSTQNLILGNQITGNYTVLTNEILLTPDGAGLVFGDGVHLYEGAGGIRSDIGFTNDLFAGGLIYMALVYLPFIAFLFSRKMGSHLLSLILFGVFVLANMKGEFFSSSVAMFIVIFVTCLPLLFDGWVTMLTSEQYEPDGESGPLEVSIE